MATNSFSRKKFPDEEWKNHNAHSGKRWVVESRVCVLEGDRCSDKKRNPTDHEPLCFYLKYLKATLEMVTRLLKK